MSLLTQEIIDNLPPLGSTNDVELKNKIIICKLFLPYRDEPYILTTWHVFEGQHLESGDYLLNCIIQFHGKRKSQKMFFLSDLEPFFMVSSFKVERDTNVFMQSYKHCR